MAEVTPKQQAPQTAAPTGQSKPAGGKGVFAFAAKTVVNAFKDERNQLDIHKINRILYLVLALVIMNFVRLVSVSAHQLKVMDLTRSISADVSAAVVPLKEKQVLKSLTSYTDKVKERNIFRMGKLAFQVQESVSTKAQEATASLRLVGISWSENPDVMIEDTKAQKTYFVKKGQLIGDIKVEAIYKDKVVLRLGQELLELR